MIPKTIGSSAIGPVAVLDPEDMAPAGGQVRWSVVRGCEDTRTAERRAAALVAGAPGGQTVDTGNSAFFKTVGPVGAQSVPARRRAWATRPSWT